jgi:hypothetical protein
MCKAGRCCRQLQCIITTSFTACNARITSTCGSRTAMPASPRGRRGEKEELSPNRKTVCCIKFTYGATVASTTERNQFLDKVTLVARRSMAERPTCRTRQRARIRREAQGYSSLSGLTRVWLRASRLRDQVIPRFRVMTDIQGNRNTSLNSTMHPK